MEKYIHYCWFGGKPLPKLAKKCIKSWKKYLPDYEIIEWNEKNFDINMTEYTKQAYAEKHWAFVSDAARIYALKKYGGIYFDTDVIVTKNFDEIIKESSVFAGWESEDYVNVAVLGVKDKNNELINKMWKFYKENEFSTENVYFLSIPTIFTNLLKTEYGLKNNHLINQKLKNGINIYSVDYFYPITSDGKTNFSSNTCMIHYFVGSWVPDSDKERLKFQLIFGKKLGNFILDILVLGKHVLKRIAKFILKPYLKYRNNKRKEKFIEDITNEFISQLDNIKSNYIVICNKNWLGTTQSVKELFDSIVYFYEIYEDVIAERIAKEINKKKIKMVIFSAFAYGWDKIVDKIKEENKNITTKIIWHGGHGLNVEEYDWNVFQQMIKLHDNNKLDSIIFVKKSMYDFYKLKDYRCEFLYNSVDLSNLDIKKNYQNDGFVKIGLYASGDRWVKNFYNQLAAASLFENAKIDCIPINDKSVKMARIFRKPVMGLSNTIDRTKLLERMTRNDIIFYVTYSECAPLIPLESLELGIPCITGNNHHYWKGTELEQYLIVNEVEDPMAIYNQAKLCLENKNKILDLYKEWRKNNIKKSKESVKSILNIKKGEK